MKTMKYIALLRGINVGGNHKVEMKKLKILCESLGFVNVSTYINSGNIFFESSEEQDVLQKKMAKLLKKEFGFEIPTLVKTEHQMRAISMAIPKNWQNDTEYRTDVAYLLPEIDSEKVLEELPIKREYLDFFYFAGAICWHLERKNYNRSYLNKLIGHKLYQLMTVRNVNTARYLAGE